MRVAPALLAAASALEVGLSVSATRSNVERDPLQPTFRSILRGARASWSLPGNASVSGTLDWLRFGGCEGAQFYTRLASVSARKDLGRGGRRGAGGGRAGVRLGLARPLVGPRERGAGPRLGGRHAPGAAAVLKFAIRPDRCDRGLEAVGTRGTVLPDSAADGGDRAFPAGVRSL